jgi:hypothetical protein
LMFHPLVCLSSRRQAEVSKSLCEAHATLFEQNVQTQHTTSMNMYILHYKPKMPTSVSKIPASANFV